MIDSVIIFDEGTSFTGIPILEGNAPFTNGKFTTQTGW